MKQSILQLFKRVIEKVIDQGYANLWHGYKPSTDTDFTYDVSLNLLLEQFNNMDYA